MMRRLRWVGWGALAGLWAASLGGFHPGLAQESSLSIGPAISEGDVAADVFERGEGSRTGRDRVHEDGAVDLRERARGAAAALEVAVSVFESPGGLVCLRAGNPTGPTVVVIPRTDGDGLARGEAVVSTGASMETQLHDQLMGSMESAVLMLQGVVHEEGVARLAHASVLIVLGPGAGLADSLAARSAAQRQAAFDLNFPWRWDEARQKRQRAAGPYPASRPDVLALSDLLLSEARVTCVVRSSPTPLGPQSSPASLTAFVKGRLLLEHRSPAKAGALPAEVSRALGDLPELRWSKPVWRRMGSDSWVVDLLLKNDGSRPTGPSQGPAKELRLPQGIDFTVQVRGESYRWLACGAAPEAPVALLDRPIRHGRAQLPSLGPGESLRVRLILGAEGNSAAAPPVLDLKASSGRALGAGMLGLAPPQAK